MKTIKLITILLLVNITQLWSTPNQSNEWQAVLQSQLATVFPSKHFSIGGVKLDKANKSLSGTGTFFSVSNIHFTASYDSPGQIASFEMEFPANAKVSFKSKGLLQIGGTQLQGLVPQEISKAVYLQKVRFDVSKTEQQIEKLGLWFESPLQWDLLPSGGLGLQEIGLHFNIDYPGDKQKRNLKGTLQGTTKLGSYPVQLEAEMAPKKEDLTFTTQIPEIGLKESLQTIVGQSIFKGIPVPNSIIDLNLKQATLSVKPYQKSANILANSNLGAVDAWMQNGEGKDKKMDYVVVISPPADFKLSKLNAKLSALDGTNLAGQKIVLTSEEKDKSKTSKIPSMAQVKTGLKKGCNLVAKLDLTKLKLDHLLQAKELIVNSPLSDKLVDVVLESAIDTDISLGANNKLSNVLFRLQPSPKNFAIALVGVMDAKVSGDHLKFKGGVELVMNTQTMNFMSIMEGNWNNPIGAKGLVLSNVGMQLGGSFAGAALLPNLAFTGELKIGKFTGSTTLAFDTRDPSKSMLAAEIKQLVVMDLMQLVIDKRVTRKLPKQMQEVLKKIRFNKVHLEFVPKPLRVLEKSYAAGFRAGGNIDIMGINGFGNMDIDYSNGILAEGYVDPIDLGPFKLTGAGKNKRPGFVIDLRKNKKPKIALNGLVNMMGIEAETEVEVLPNGFRFDLGGKVFNVFKGKVMASAADLERLGSIQAKVQMQQDLFGFIDREVVKFVQNSTGEAIKKLTKAQRKISTAQAEVKKLDGEINRQRVIVKKDQAKDRAKITKAQRDVTNAQNKVNGLKSLIKQKQKEAKRLTGVRNIAKRAAVETKIKSLQASHGIAWTALEGYKKVLGGFKGLNTNPDLDIRVAGLIASKHTAIGSLEVAKGSLEALKLTLGVTGNVASFIIDKGTDALIDVRKASFAGQLRAMSGGAVKMDMELKWMGKPMDFELDFNFKSPVEMAKALGKRLMKIKK